MDWANILSIRPNDLTTGVLETIPNHLSSIDVNELNVDELRNFFELNRFLINRLSNDTKKKKTLAKDPEKKLSKNSATDESYYIQTIQELNREIAQHVCNKKASNDDGTVNASNGGEADSLQPLTVDTKKDLLYKIHIKNKYIKRLLSENDALKVEIDQQKEQVLMLNVSLKQTAHKLAQAIGDLSEQKTRNHMTADDMANLHAKINSVREQMTQIERDKQKYKHDVLYLGDEIQKKINQWNELLQKKYNNSQINERVTLNDTVEIRNFDDAIDQRSNDIDVNRYDENRFEVNVLSEAINKRNIIITEMESLLIDLTMEISQSAVVINRIIKNLSKRETNFATNLEKLRNHLAKLLERPNIYENDIQNGHKSSKRRTKKK
ncbi:myosin heavy chain, striated muscle-like [Contarinia nasturtii]|uniref:myosin heavy chain, striated muscle-like n=1 Tax=Contarinia nasturtii TaxID=265458 RepID=UPI0012D3E6FD|nr:myosin heavy chain, striated muscle-like [Contarinia nasturtii]